MEEKLSQKADKLTEEAVKFFVEVMCKTYRKTFEEADLSERLVRIFRQQLGLSTYSCERKKNVVVYKNGTGKYAQADFPVILQSHMDMVCVSNHAKPGVTTKDVFSEGIELYYADKEKTKMRGRSVKYPDTLTSLGADDGIGVAAIYAILANQDIAHPPLIAILTTEEEDGMGGASTLTLDEIKKVIPDSAPLLHFGKAKFINIDDERDGIFSISCAGTLRGSIVLPIVRGPTHPEGLVYYTLSVSGLQGGHSGLQIQEGRANANILLCDVLLRLTYTDIDLSFFMLGKCGEASNAIPSQASATIAVSADKAKLFEFRLSLIEDFLKDKYYSTDPRLELKLSPTQGNPSIKPYSAGTLASLLFLVRALPDAALMWDKSKEESLIQIDGHFQITEQFEEEELLVETSSNLGLMEEKGETVVLTCMLRSSIDAMKTCVMKDMEMLSRIYGATFKLESSSPGWAYKKDNSLRDLFLKTYNALFAGEGQEAKAVATHAALECGYFAQKLGDIEMIACGPKLTDVHSIQETLYINTVPKLMKLLTVVLEEAGETQN